ncbi:MAG: hypothetical protein GXP32_00925 [Kiritimatiellaeota bacterium]|nr:hypothetical protein [Kiritimatiellota bacterium]
MNRRSSNLETRQRLSPFSRHWSGWAAAAILTVFVCVGVASVRIKAPTFDETVHILGGYTVLTKLDYHVNPENGILPQVWAALPLALNSKITPPDMKSAGWLSGLTWNAASNFLYTSGNDPGTILITARTMMLLMAAACGFLVFVISKRIWGVSGGLFSLALFALSPTIMANARLVSSDLASALFFLLSIWAWQLVSERVTAKRLSLFCVGMSGLFLSKMSAPLIIPAILAVLAVRLFRRKPLRVAVGSARFAVVGQFKQLLTLSAVVLLGGAAVFAAIWGSSFFRYSILPDDTLRNVQDRKWELLMEDASFPVKVVFSVKKYKLLPEHYLYGFAHVLHESKTRHAFLNGRRSETGWWWFFPATFGMKTPPALILFILAGLVFPFVVVGNRGKKKRHRTSNTQRRTSNIEHSMSNGEKLSEGGSDLNDATVGDEKTAEADSGRRDTDSVAGVDASRNAVDFRRLRRISLARRLAFAFVFVAVYVTFSLATNLNIGHRHLIPIYPPLFIIAGGVMFAIRRSKKRAIGRTAPGLNWKTIAFLMFALLAENVVIFPDYLAYFSPLVGGSANGYKHLVDSSLDWGQDLKRLKSYIEKTKADDGGECYVAYFGSVNLTAYRLPGKRLLCAFEQFSYDVFPLSAGTYCVSATMLQMDYYPELADWNSELEKLYREYRGKFREFRAELAKKKTLRNKKRLNELFRDYKVFEKLRFAKLADSLRRWKPDGDIGHSILIYKLSEKELSEIMNN